MWDVGMSKEVRYLFHFLRVRLEEVLARLWTVNVVLLA